MRETSRVDKYTFYLPAFKGAYLNKALHSIQQQTYTEFHVVVSDDCSLENIKGIFDEAVGEDSRFTYRRNERNIGKESLVKHWNLLIEQCKTEFLILASDDDIYSPTFLEEIDNLTLMYPNVDLYRARVKTINGNGEIIKVENPSNDTMTCLEYMHRFYQEDFISCVSNYCYRTSRLKSIGMFPDFPLAWFSDDAANIAMAENGCATTPEILFSFRLSGLNISSHWGDKKDCMKKIQATICFSKWMEMHMKTLSYPQEKNDTIKDIQKSYRHKIFTNIQNNIYYCPARFLISHLFEIPSNIGISKIRILAHWINARKYRK